MPDFPIRSGVVNLPAAQPRRLTALTVDASAGSVAITRPDGSVLLSVVGAVQQLSLLNMPELAPGAYTVAVTGVVTGTFTTANN